MTFKARGQRTDELPHSYQVMLFWAGLRGAVGVALAAGMKGENAVALRTTVLVTVVLTVVVFGGTIGRMIEILGIRTGVDVEDDSSEEEEGYRLVNQGEEGGRKVKRKVRVGKKPFGGRGEEGEEGVLMGDSPYTDRFMGGRRESGNGDGSYRASVGSAESLSDEESETDVLPSVNAAVDGEGGAGAGAGAAGDLTRVWRDGQWFTVLDERYLLPVFSNATASRRQASKKALKAKRSSFAVEQGDLSYDAGAAGGDMAMLSAPPSPDPQSVGHARASTTDYNGSFGDILSSLVSPSLPSNPLSTSTSPVPFRRRDDEEGTFDLGSPPGKPSGNGNLGSDESGGSGGSERRRRRKD
jgi:sodium/hydrogen exchanger-like protein 6/7